MIQKFKVLIAGIGGASLGTEILKSLLITERYQIYGCDISNLAFGHYQIGFQNTFVVNRNNYTNSILEVCQKEGIKFIIPGGEEPMVLLGLQSNFLQEQGVILVGNSPEVINTFSDKAKTFQILKEMGFKIPITKTVLSGNDLNDFSFPCIIKPSTGSGGSSFVFLAGDKEEALIYTDYLLRNEKTPIIQEYIPEDDGEFTVGVLSVPTEQVIGSVVLKRAFNSKLSVSFNGKRGLISSGYSQGLIDNFPEIRLTAENIARKIKSKGPINIQGRVKKGVFIPFEINPRFSASTYLRAMAGFNEVDIFLQFLVDGFIPKMGPIVPGYYLRSLTETFIKKDELKV